jgi:hypothetical protein
VANGASKSRESAVVGPKRWRDDGWAVGERRGHHCLLVPLPVVNVTGAAPTACRAFL